LQAWILDQKSTDGLTAMPSRPVKKAQNGLNRKGGQPMSEEVKRGLAVQPWPTQGDFLTVI